MTNTTVAASAFEILGSSEASIVLDRVLNALGQWQQIAETERTKRETIAASERKWLAAIEADRQVLLTYLDGSFDERAENFRQLFNALDRAMATDVAQVADLLGAITTLAMKSPFNDLKDITVVTANLRDHDHEW